MNAAAKPPSETISHADGVVVSARSDVASAARLLRDRGVRHLLVVDDGPNSVERNVGTVTGHDIAVFVVACERDPRTVKVADVMQRPSECQEGRLFKPSACSA
jgi:CBS domain-containing protein